MGEDFDSWENARDSEFSRSHGRPPDREPSVWDVVVVVLLFIAFAIFSFAFLSLFGGK